MRLITHIVAAAMVFATMEVAYADFPYGSPANVKLSLAGCRDLATMNRVAELILENDIEAAIKVAIRAGTGCRLFEEGEKVIVEEFSTPHSLVCIRVKGDPDCFWYPSNFLEDISN